MRDKKRKTFSMLMLLPSAALAGSPYDSPTRPSDINVMHSIEALCNRLYSGGAPAESTGGSGAMDCTNDPNLVPENIRQGITLFGVVGTYSGPTPPPSYTPTSSDFFHDTLQDGSAGPEMVWIPAGTFRMGGLQGNGEPNEAPVHEVSVDRFAIGRYEVTFAEYDKFAEATHAAKPKDKGWGRGNRPVMNVSWNEAAAYTKWLSRETGHPYRLPTEAEWEYAARAGTETSYWWGNEIGSNQANCYGCGSQWDDNQTAPVGSFSPNPWGLYDTAGNLWEWTCSAYEMEYDGAEQRCPHKREIIRHSLFALRGGSWGDEAETVRSASRVGWTRLGNDKDGGFRLVRE